MDNDNPMHVSCPLPHAPNGQITLAHGGGGALMHELVQNVFFRTLDNPNLDGSSDSAVFTVGGQRLAFTTDSFVVKPLEFPGGDIGKLAVCGTINDLATSGARPLYLSLGMILEEGLNVELLQRIVQTIADTASGAGVEVATGDTKVIERGNGDGMFINTAGIGVIEHDLTLGPRQIQPGDAILVNGSLGRHGMAVMAKREGLAFESTLESDVAPLHGLVQALLDAGITLRCARDLTRGGLASALNEIAQTAGKTLRISEQAAPVDGEVRDACEILGLDPLYVANEGRMAFIVPEEQLTQAMDVLSRWVDAGMTPAHIGTVTDEPRGRVLLENAFGSSRILDLLSGEQLPRIC